MTLLPRHPAQKHVKELARRSSHLAPLAGRGRRPRVCARMPGEGQQRIPKREASFNPQKAPHPCPLPASGAREHFAWAPVFERVTKWAVLARQNRT
jgi:hypothetical protein